MSFRNADNRQRKSQNDQNRFIKVNNENINQRGAYTTATSPIMQANFPQSYENMVSPPSQQYHFKNIRNLQSKIQQMTDFDQKIRQNQASLNRTEKMRGTKAQSLLKNQKRVHSKNNMKSQDLQARSDMQCFTSFQEQKYPDLNILQNNYIDKDPGQFHGMSFSKTPNMISQSAQYLNSFNHNRGSSYSNLSKIQSLSQMKVSSAQEYEIQNALKRLNKANLLQHSSVQSSTGSDGGTGNFVELPSGKRMLHQYEKGSIESRKIRTQQSHNRPRFLKSGIQTQISQSNHQSAQHLINRGKFNEKITRTGKSQMSLQQLQNNRFPLVLDNIDPNQDLYTKDKNQYTPDNLTKFMKQSRSRSQFQKKIPSSNRNALGQYDINGRKSKIRAPGVTEMRVDQQKIENQYLALQQSYEEIFKNQQDYRNTQKNINILNQFQQNCIEDQYYQGRSQGTTLAQNENESKSQFDNRNNFQNNISNSIILLQAPGGNQMDIINPQQNQLLGELNILKQQLQDPTATQNYSPDYSKILSPKSQMHNITSPLDQSSRGRREERLKYQSDSQDSTKINKDLNHMIKKKGHESPTTSNGKRDVRMRSSNNKSNLRSNSGDVISSNDPESIERQNNQMLMQMLYNNLRKNQKKKKRRNYSPDSGSPKPIGIKRVRIASGNQSEKASSSNKKVMNFSNYVKQKVLKSENKSQGQMSQGAKIRQNIEIQDNFIEQTVMELPKFNQRIKSLPKKQPETHMMEISAPLVAKVKPPKEVIVKTIKDSSKMFEIHNSNQIQKGINQNNKPIDTDTPKKMVQAVKAKPKNDKMQKISDASTKIEKLLRDNDLSNDFDREKITSSLIQLLSEQNDIKNQRPVNLKFDTENPKRRAQVTKQKSVSLAKKSQEMRSRSNERPKDDFKKTSTQKKAKKVNPPRLSNSKMSGGKSSKSPDKEEQENVEKPVLAKKKKIVTVEPKAVTQKEKIAIKEIKKPLASKILASDKKESSPIKSQRNVNLQKQQKKKQSNQILDSSQLISSGRNEKKKVARTFREPQINIEEEKKESINLIVNKDNNQKISEQNTVQFASERPRISPDNSVSQIISIQDSNVVEVPQIAKNGPVEIKEENLSEVQEIQLKLQLKAESKPESSAESKPEPVVKKAKVFVSPELKIEKHVTFNAYPMSQTQDLLEPKQTEFKHLKERMDSHADTEKTNSILGHHEIQADNPISISDVERNYSKTPMPESSDITQFIQKVNVESGSEDKKVSKNAPKQLKQTQDELNFDEQDIISNEIQEEEKDEEFKEEAIEDEVSEKINSVIDSQSIEELSVEPIDQDVSQVHSKTSVIITQTPQKSQKFNIKDSIGTPQFHNDNSPDVNKQNKNDLEIPEAKFLKSKTMRPSPVQRQKFEFEEILKGFVGKVQNKEKSALISQKKQHTLHAYEFSRKTLPPHKVQNNDNLDLVQKNEQLLKRVKIRDFQKLTSDFDKKIFQSFDSCIHNCNQTFTEIITTKSLFSKQSTLDFNSFDEALIQINFEQYQLNGHEYNIFNNKVHSLNNLLQFTDFSDMKQKIEKDRKQKSKISKVIAIINTQVKKRQIELDLEQQKNSQKQTNPLFKILNLQVKEEIYEKINQNDLDYLNAQCTSLNSKMEILKLDYTKIRDKMLQEEQMRVYMNNNIPSSPINSQDNVSVLNSKITQDQRRKDFIKKKSGEFRANQNSPLLNKANLNSVRSGSSKRRQSKSFVKNSNDHSMSSQKQEYSDSGNTHVSCGGKSGRSGCYKDNSSTMIDDTMRSSLSMNYNRMVFKIVNEKSILAIEQEIIMILKFQTFMTRNKSISDEKQNNPKILKRCHSTQLGRALILKVAQAVSTSTDMLDKYQEFKNDKQNIEKLFQAYYEEQHNIQYPQGNQITGTRLDHHDSMMYDEDSDIGLDSTISSMSQFSCQDHTIEETEYIPASIQTNSQLQLEGSPFQYAQFEEHIDKLGQINIIEYNSEIDDPSSDSYRRGQIPNINSVVSLRSQKNKIFNTSKGLESAQIHHRFGLNDHSRSSQRSSWSRKYCFTTNRNFDQSIFFNNESQQIMPIERVSRPHVAKVLEQHDLKSILDSQSNNTPGAIHDKLNNRLIDMIKKKMKTSKFSQIDLTLIKNKFGVIQQDFMKHNLPHSLLIKTFNLEYLINEMFFAQLDYQEWQLYRINVVRQQNIHKQIENLNDLNMDVFWSNESKKVLNQFLKNKNNDILLQEADISSISSEFDGELYNNQHHIQNMHDNTNPLPLIKTIIKDKNMQYEIFRILSQTKMHQIKNKVMEDLDGGYENRISMIDSRLHQIQCLTILSINEGKVDDSEQGKNKDDDGLMYLLHQQVDNSSDWSSDDSLEQSSKYLYIENLEYQNYQRSLQQKPQESQPSSELESGNKQYVYGFRYAEKRQNISTINDSSMVSYTRHSYLARQNQNFIFKQPSQTEDETMIRLNNGLPLHLKDDPNIELSVDHCSKAQRKKAEEERERIQGYYDEIKSHMKKRSKKDKIVIKYKRQRCLKGSEISNDVEAKILKKLTCKMQQTWGQKLHKKAISLDITQQLNKKYHNPFELPGINPFNISTEQLRLIKAQVAEEKKQESNQNNQSKIVVKSKKFHTADDNQANGVEDSYGKPLNYRQGEKCKNFKFICKLQSLGDFNQLQKLENEMARNEQGSDVLEWSEIIDPNSGSPIYMLFEVLHPQVKTAFDCCEEQATLIQKLKQLSNQAISGIRMQSTTKYVQRQQEKQQQVINKRTKDQF